MQRAYIVGRNPAIPLGGISCHSHLEFERPDLDPAVFERAWNALIGRNEILRLVIEGDERQRVLPEVPWVRIPVVQLPGTDPDGDAAVIARIRDDLSRQMRDPAQWPLHEVRIARYADGRLRIFVHFDLIGIDATSAARLSDLLQREVEGETRDDDRAHMVASYRDHSIAESKRRDDATWRRDRAFWRDALPSLPAAPQLPYAAPFSELTPPRFTRLMRTLPGPVIDDLKLAASRHRLSIGQVVNAAFAEIVATWSSDRRFLLNLPVFMAPERRSDRATPLGNFTSTLLVDADMASGCFAERAQGLARKMGQALRHRRYSGVRVLQDLGRLQHGPLQPLAPVVLTNMAANRTSGAIWQPDGPHSVTYTPQVVLDHQIRSVEDAFVFYWDSVVGALQPGVVEAMADAHGLLLEGLASDDGRWTDAAFDILPSSQRRVRTSANATRCALDQRSLHDGFFTQAQERPDDPAMIEGERVVTFAELAGLAGHVLARLAEIGVQPQEAVACALPHGIDLAAVALGTLAHGAVYAPLDPVSPPGRRSRETAILKPRIAFVDATSRASFAGSSVPIVEWDARSAASRPCTPAPRRVEPSDRAYVIFTSGTTGDPKAIAISHRGAVNTCADLVERLSLTAQDRVLALSAPTFDLAIFDMFGLWAAGGCVVVPDPRRRLDPAAWVEAMAEHRVTVWNTVPAFVGMLVAHGTARALTADTLRVVMMSGDWIPPALIPGIARVAPGATSFALGGATEASIWSIIHPIVPADAHLPSIPYGWPLRNQTIHILDELFGERPDHVEGDIYIGGVGLSEGYVGDPDGTAAAFIVHPRTGERLYRTGDRGRRRMDGEIEFLGRRDTQFKRQGFRIEAGEVETALKAADGVVDAVLESTGDRFGAKRLIAFVVPAQREGAKRRTLPPGLPLPGSVASRIPLDRPPARAAGAREPRRSSARGFDPRPVAFDALKTLLQQLCVDEEEGRPRFRYPSAGAIYPVKAYLLVAPQCVHGLDGGLYAVDPSGSLAFLSYDVGPFPDMHVPHNRDLAARSAFTLLLFAHLPSMTPTYGGLARDLCLIEAGYIGQMLMEAATETEVALCPIGALSHHGVVAAAGLGTEDVFLHAFLGGVRAEGAWTGADPSARTDEKPDRMRQRLRAHLASRLPSYMLPDEIVLIDRLPLSANGKVDRAVLREHVPIASEASTPPSMPTTDVERRLASLASRVLDLDIVDLDREFFELGADSLKLVQLAAAVEQEFERSFPVMDAFAHPTLRRMAAYLSAGDAPNSDATIERARRRAANRRRASMPRGPGSRDA